MLATVSSRGDTRGLEATDADTGSSGSTIGSNTSFHGESRWHVGIIQRSRLFESLTRDACGGLLIDSHFFDRRNFNGMGKRSGIDV